MAVRPVLIAPHPTLKQRARELASDQLDRAAAVAADLLDTMHASPGCVGIAAPQIDELVRLIVVDVSGHRRHGQDAQGLLQLVNPEIAERDGAEIGREGCLSIPEFTANVRRATTIRVEALSPTGEPLTIESHGFEARCLQHEIDHLDGILFLDRVDSIHDDVFRRKQRTPR